MDELEDDNGQRPLGYFNFLKLNKEQVENLYTNDNNQIVDDLIII